MPKSVLLCVISHLSFKQFYMVSMCIYTSTFSMKTLRSEWLGNLPKVTNIYVPGIPLLLCDIN